MPIFTDEVFLRATVTQRKIKYGTETGRYIPFRVEKPLEKAEKQLELEKVSKRLRYLSKKHAARNGYRDKATDEFSEIEADSDHLENDKPADGLRSVAHEFIADPDDCHNVVSTDDGDVNGLAANEEPTTDC